MKFFVALGILLLVIVATDAGHSMHNPFFCYTTDPIRSMINMHAIMTSYEAIRRFNFTTVNPYISTCTPSRFWYLGRYGGRFPLQPTFNNMIGFVNSSIQSDIVSNYGAGRTTLCREDFEAIRNWTIGSNFNIAGLTTEAGIIAMQNIARRYQAIFPDILTESYSADRFLFRHTNTEVILVTNDALQFKMASKIKNGTSFFIYQPILMNFCLSKESTYVLPSMEEKSHVLDSYGFDDFLNRFL